MNPLQPIPQYPYIYPCAGDPWNVFIGHPVYPEALAMSSLDERLCRQLTVGSSGPIGTAARISPPNQALNEEFYRMKLYAAEYLHPRTETPAKKLERLETLTPVSASPEPHASSLQRTHSPTAESNLASSCQLGKRSLDQPWAEEAACTRYEDQAPENSVKESLVGDCRDEQACLSEVGNDEAGEWESVIESDLVETWTEVQKSWKCGGSWEQVKSKMRKRSWIN
ncbi:MAG: hypothetical protein Q9190_007098 [Brigantiaea leucoxantha]